MPFFATTYHYAADSTAARDAVRPAHRDYLAELTQQGRLLVSGPHTGEPAAALLVFEADDEAGARSLADADPFVVEGLVAEISVREWTIVSGRLASQL